MSTLRGRASTASCARRRCCGTRCSPRRPGSTSWSSTRTTTRPAPSRCAAVSNLVGQPVGAASARGVDYRDDRQPRAIDRAGMRARGVPCTIVVPLGNNPEKNAAMRAYGAELIEYGRDFDEAREQVEQLQHERGCATSTRPTSRCSSPGVGTYALEIFEAAAGRPTSSSCRSAAAAARAAASIVRSGARQPRQGHRRPGGAR